MGSRQAMLARIVDAIGDRSLVWSGLRGDDIEPLRDVPQLSAAFAIAGSYSGRPDVRGLAYEQLSGSRVDPEIWDIEAHLDLDETQSFRRSMLRVLGEPSVLLPYRSSNFISAVQFARQDRCTTLGMFGAHQSAFEHKPFVESAVAKLGVPHVPWTYIADEEQPLARELLASGSLVLRRSRTSGGEGVVRACSGDEISEFWPRGSEEFVSVAPFIGDALPVNVGATVWGNAPNDDCVTVHHASVQLIGLTSCVTREFGYCGNDFGAARDLDRATIEQVEASTKAIGRWLRSNGYLGTFGVDFLVKDGAPLFSEVNPRFQGSTYSSCRLSNEAGEPCLMLEHLAAWLGLPISYRRGLYERTREVRDLTNLAVHWTSSEVATVNAPALFKSIIDEYDRNAEADSLVAAGIASEPGSLVGRVGVGRRVTSTGYDLEPELGRLVERWQQSKGAA